MNIRLLGFLGVCVLLADAAGCFLSKPLPSSLEGLACEPDDDCGNGLACIVGVCKEIFPEVDPVNPEVINILNNVTEEFSGFFQGAGGVAYCMFARVPDGQSMEVRITQTSKVPEGCQPEEQIDCGGQWSYSGGGTWGVSGAYPPTQIFRAVEGNARIDNFIFYGSGTAKIEFFSPATGVQPFRTKEISWLGGGVEGEGEGEGECTSKCDCDPGQLCKDELCVPASTDSCQDSDDCPRGPLDPTDQCEAFQCNGFTDQCFDPDPASRLCTQASECVGRPGCVGGAVCTCTDSGDCVPDVACTVQNESTTCGFGNFCDGDGRCRGLPACTVPGDCTDGLVCNGGTGFCERPQPCAVSADCGIAPNTFCADNFCTVPTCTNLAITCVDPQVCNPQGLCVPTCVDDTTCQANEYCDSGIPGSRVCAVGCRDNSSCPGGQVCAGNRQCVAEGQFGDPCIDATECQAPMVCGLLAGTCAEPCATPADCVACNAVNGACTCNGVGFCTP
jgi:hypothetical protein